ncbi:DUF58 domain-containing protein [Shimia haliotis]|uniref:DUF58 domain-containing protein n=1 Tax=Shimia haliotis TaxID=1280847 RepID=A0A1I4HG40_9RHOB|nr:DUF58 domain-containing protein [Shimia haliotis]SFL40720.1 Protein of unknown function DUF58 [Shimia haliotis]
MRDLNAKIRTGLVSPLETGAEDPRVQVTLDRLRALEGRARALNFLPKQPVRSALNGRHTSRIRGRGLDFEELRDYLPSDDVRSIDWKVTARTGSPHVRVFTEERDRPTLIVLDQRMSMFFGTVLNMKSVTAAECAALTAFRVLDQGDQIGGIVFGDSHIAEFRPKRSRQTLMQFLTAISRANSLLHAEAPNDAPMAINDILRSIQKIAPRNHLIIFISDFDEVDETTRLLLSGMSRRNDIVLGLVTDPSAHDLPKGAPLVATDGTLQAEFDLSDTIQRGRLLDFSRGRVQRILDWQTKMRLSVLPLTTAEPTLEQMQRLMGIAP